MKRAPTLFTCALFTLSGPLAAAADVQKAADADETIGTTAAAPPEPANVTAPSSPSSAHAEGGTAFIASDPPKDWAVLHAGLRPHLGTFGGLATFALAHGRTEKFYGAFSFSAIRHDAGTHASLAQISLGGNLADTYIGGVEASIAENRARHFYGLGQVALGYDRASEMTGAFQLASYNRAKRFHGGAQLGLYNRADDEFSGLFQLGAFNQTRGNFTGLFQLGAVSTAGEAYDVGNPDGHFVGVLQAGAVTAVASNFAGLGQVGLGALTTREF
jgi:hypothetical protein